jgi:hypothetical protein
VTEGVRGPHEIGLLLAVAMCVLPFLVPYHQLPILSFYPEWLAVALGVPAALCVLAWRGGVAEPLPALSLWLVALALYVLARAFMGQPYPQIGVLGACYVLFAALMVWLGAQLSRTLGAERVCSVLAVALLVGALANALAGAVQFYGRPALLEDVVADLAGRRAYGNIAQANLYANYLALGQCALVFLWFRRRVPTGPALLIALFLGAASALSGSRIALLLAVWIALLGALSSRLVPGGDFRRLALGAWVVGGCIFAMHFAVPWVNEALGLHRAGESALDRMSALVEAGEPRWEIYSLGLRVFASAPVLGVGLGAFPGAAFELGLDSSLTRSGEVLTSPHNLLLHLLAETGVPGAALCLGGLCVWGWQVHRRLSSGAPALWWSLAAAGVELLHSLFEFPLWSADFLGVAALVMGVGLAQASPCRSMRGAIRTACVGGCAVLMLALVVLLGDYVRLDTTRVTGSAVTLASPADAARDAATLRGLGRGPLAPVAELWIVQGAPLDRSDLSGMLERSRRVATFWPSPAVLMRRAALLALDGRAEEARALHERTLRAFPHLHAEPRK